MGVIRNGARSFLRLLDKACKLSHIPGFRAGLNTILGTTVTTNLYVVWTPLCTFIDNLVSIDNWFNQKDQVDDDAAGEDFEPL